MLVRLHKSLRRLSNLNGNSQPKGWTRIPRRNKNQLANRRRRMQRAIRIPVRAADRKPSRRTRNEDRHRSARAVRRVRLMSSIPARREVLAAVRSTRDSSAKRLTEGGFCGCRRAASSLSRQVLRMRRSTRPGGITIPSGLDRSLSILRVTRRTISEVDAPPLGGCPVSLVSRTRLLLFLFWLNRGQFFPVLQFSGECLHECIAT